MQKKKDNTMMISVILMLICYVMGIVFFVRNTIYLGIIWLVLGTVIIICAVRDRKKEEEKGRLEAKRKEKQRKIKEENKPKKEAKKESKKKVKAKPKKTSAATKNKK